MPAESTKLADPMGWSEYTASTKYEIERIVSATRLPGGWRYMVKWVGYPDPTPEAQWKILRDTQNPEILEQMEQCKQDYLSTHPAERTMIEGATDAEDEEAIKPSRVQPHRERSKTTRFTFLVHGVMDPPSSAYAIGRGFNRLCKETKRRCHALRQFVPDFSLV